MFQKSFITNMSNILLQQAHLQVSNKKSSSNDNDPFCTKSIQSTQPKLTSRNQCTGTMWFVHVGERPNSISRVIEAIQSASLLKAIGPYNIFCVWVGGQSPRIRIGIFICFLCQEVSLRREDS